MKKPIRHPLESLRFDYGLTQSELGELLEISQMTVSRLEKGKKEIDYEMKKKIEDVFGVSMNRKLW